MEPAAGGDILSDLDYLWMSGIVGQNIGDRAIALATLMLAQVVFVSTPSPIHLLAELIKRKAVR